MKAIAIVELPDDAFDKGRWHLDKICYTEKESLFDDFANGMWELKPLPKEEEPIDEVVELGSYNEGYGNGYECGFADGWNACLKEITK